MAATMLGHLITDILYPSTGGLGLPLEELVGLLHQAGGERALELLDVFRLDAPEQHFNAVHDFMASLLVSRHAPAFTANFDELIEGARLRRSGTALTQQRAATDEEFIAHAKQSATLFKVHGTASVRASLQITFADIGAELSAAKGGVVNAIFSTHHGCIVGWAAADADLEPVVRRALWQARRNGYRWYYFLYPRTGCLTLSDYRYTDGPALDFAAHLELPIIIARSEVVFPAFHVAVFGSVPLVGSTSNTKSIEGTVAPLVTGLVRDKRTLIHHVVGGALHRVQMHQEADAVMAEGIDVGRGDDAEQTGFYLARSHAAFDAGDALRALRFAAHAVALAPLQDDVLRGRAFFGLVTQLLAPNWLRQLVRTRSVGAVPFIVKQVVLLPVRWMTVRWLLARVAGSRNMASKRAAELSLASLATREVAGVELLLGRILGWPRLAPIRRPLVGHLTSALEVCLTWNDLHGQYDALRCLARLKAWDSPGEALANLAEAKRLCEVMTWRDGLVALESVERELAQQGATRVPHSR